MLKATENGTIKLINGLERIYYEGYWIRHYEIPDTLVYKKELIDLLTRRVFHNTEPGINTPGERLEIVRNAYEKMQDPAQKRVLAAMLAGALLNRGSDILTKVVELEEMGVMVQINNELLRECGRCFMGALEYGKHIRPLYGEEGLDEFWGEPFKVFTMPIEQYLNSRYLKIAQTMKAIDSVTETLLNMFEDMDMFAGISDQLTEIAESAKLATETRRRDMAMIEFWPRFVAAAEKLSVCQPIIPEGASRREHTMGRRGAQLIQDGTNLILYLVNKRIPMPKTTQEFLNRCDKYSDRYLSKLTT